MILKLAYLLLALFATCSIALYRPEPSLAKQQFNPELLNAIASFYAGRPLEVAFPEKKPGTYGSDSGWGSNGWGGNVFEGRVNLGPFQKKMLEQMFASPRGNRFGQGTMAGLSTLIHEALHARAPQPGTGFQDWSNEKQANALGSELVADALNRFFGIKIGSPTSNRLMKEAKSLSGYQGAYGPSTPTRPL